MYRLGCDLGVDTTTWSRVPVGVDPTSSAVGSVPSVVAVGTDGELRVVGPDSAADAEVTTRFVDALGASEPVMVGGTPYGVEALVGCVLAEVVAVNVAQTGAVPAKFALVHDDDLDPYRRSLLTEAARSAGISVEQFVLVRRSDADAADDDDAAAGAAAVAAASLPPVVGGAGGASDVAAAGGVAAGGVAGAAGAAGVAGAGPSTR